MLNKEFVYIDNINNVIHKSRVKVIEEFGIFVLIQFYMPYTRTQLLTKSELALLNPVKNEKELE